MTKEIIIIALILALIYLYYQNRKSHLLTGNSSDPDYQQEVSETISDLRTQLNQALSLQTANELKITEQKQEIRNLQTELRKLEELSPDKEISTELTELEDERDELKRENITLNQEITARGNQIRNKNKEIENKVKEIERLKKEKEEKEVSLNKKISEKNKEIEELKKKYSKQGQLLDTEQTENNKLEKVIEQLTNKITELETERKELLKSMPGEFPEDDEKKKKTVVNNPNFTFENLKKSVVEAIRERNSSVLREPPFGKEMETVAYFEKPFKEGRAEEEIAELYNLKREEIIEKYKINNFFIINKIKEWYEDLLKERN